VRLAALPLLLALLLALAACGEDDGDSAPTTESGTTTGTTTGGFEEPEPLPRTEVEGGYLYEVAEDGFEVAVPRPWIARSSAQIPNAGTLRRLSVEYTEIIGYFETLVGDTPTRFVAAAPRLRKNFATNLTVTIEAVEPGTSLEQYEGRTYAQILSTAANVEGEIERSRETIPAGPVRVIRYERRFSDAITLATRHYLLVSGDRAFALTYTTVLPDPSFDEIVARSLESFRLVED
jgi:hypothetical protein